MTMLIVEQNANLALDIAAPGLRARGRRRSCSSGAADELPPRRRRPPGVPGVLGGRADDRLAFPVIERQLLQADAVPAEPRRTALANGAVYALMALTVVIIYKTTGHLNFAQGEMAMFSTVPRLRASPSSRAGTSGSRHARSSSGSSMMLGAAIERSLIRPLERRSVLGAVILTLGPVLRSSTALAAVIWGTQPATPIPQPFPGQLERQVRHLATGRPSSSSPTRPSGSGSTVAVLVVLAQPAAARRPSSASPTEPWPPTPSPACWSASRSSAC